MPCPHEGHDADCSHEIECVVCREIVRDPEHHTCARPQGATP